MTKRIILPVLIILSFGGPAVAFLMNRSFERNYGFVFFIFILIHALLRIWETFFTSREENPLVLTDDWSLVFVTTVYVSLCYVVIVEFYLVSRTFNIYVTIFGVVLYLAAFRLRWWGIKTLGKQWAIHAIGRKKLVHKRIIKLGPYRYIRHPIYTGTLVEQLGIVLIANTHYSLLYFLFLTTPAYFFRMRMEEKSNLRIFRTSYARYRKEVGMILPRFGSPKGAK